MWYVYLIENKVNGKLYVGKSYNVNRRWKQHQNIASNGKQKYPKDYQYLHSAISKYGKQNFVIKTIGSYELENDAFDNEIKYITQLQSEGYKLYNLTNGGEGMSGYKFSDESKQKMSLANKGRKRSEETKRNISIARKGNTNRLGIPHTVEYRQRMSLAVSKSLMSYGENNSRAKLNWNDVNKIRELINNGYSNKTLSMMFNISRSVISSIRHNKAWILPT